MKKYELAKNYYEIHGDLNVPLIVLRKRCEAGKVDIQYKVQTETSGIQRNGIKPGQDQTDWTI